VLGMAEDTTLARREAAGGGLDPRTRGTVVHAILEHLDFASAAAPTAQEVGARAELLGIALARADRAEIAALIAGALDAAPIARIARAVRLRREFPFAFSLSPELPLITGVIDVLALEPDGGSLVLDYKSDRVGAELDLREYVEGEYGIQRLLYALAVLRDGAPRVEVAHWFLERPGEWVAATYATDQRETLERSLAARVAGDLERGYPVSPTPHRALCLTCPGRAGLCSWGDADTLREHPAEPPGEPETASQSL